jgi:hypothetical protein
VEITTFLLYAWGKRDFRYLRLTIYKACRHFSGYVYVLDISLFRKDNIFFEGKYRIR